MSTGPEPASTLRGSSMKRFKAAVPPQRKKETRKAKGIANQTTPDTVKQYDLSDEIPCKENPKRNRPPIHKEQRKRFG